MAVSLHKVPLAEPVPLPRFEFYLWASGGHVPVKDFLVQLQQSQLRKVQRLLVHVAQNGLPGNPERYLKLRGYENLHEFKLHQIRLYFFIDAGRIILTEGVLKKQNRSDRNTLDKADERRKRFYRENG